jgi:hypothetical protein
MADHDDPERFAKIAETVLAAFGFVRALLTDLPVPISVPDFDPEADDQLEALMSLNRVRALLADEPIGDTAKRAYERLVLEWFTAYEMVVLTKMAGPAPWRLDAVEFTLLRIATLGEMIELGEIEEDDES